MIDEWVPSVKRTMARTPWSVSYTHLDVYKRQPYNTYLRKGLPPTPIAMPGADALAAVANPAAGDALYFVATGEGGHTFSATLEEHHRAVRRYQSKGR